MVPLTIEVKDPTGAEVLAETDLSTLPYGIPDLKLRNRAASTFTLRNRGGDPAGAPPIAYGDTVFIRGTLAGQNGGVKDIIFQGRRIRSVGHAATPDRAVDITIADAWYDLQYTTFQHLRRHHGPTDPVLATDFMSRINLFQDISAGPADHWAYLSVHDQIREIITYAKVNCLIAIQAGTIDCNTYRPIYAVKAVSCADALLLCLRSIPDAVTYFDYSTTPPTLHVRQRPNLVALAFPYADGVKHQSSRIERRDDLIPDSVVIQYEQIFDVNGTRTAYWSNDAFPIGATGAAFGSLVTPVDLRGGIITNVFGALAAQAIDPTTRAFWKSKKPDLANALVVFPNTDAAAITNVKVAIKGGPNDGMDVTATWRSNYPNELKPGGGVAPWMTIAGDPVIVQEVTITASAIYTKQDKTPDNAHQIDAQKPTAHNLSVNLKLTNSPDTTDPVAYPDGLQHYSALAQADPGDSPPDNLAYDIYQSLNQLQYEGDHVILEKNVNLIPTPGNVLNLTGGNAAWTNMRAQIYDVHVEFFDGRTTINFGPTKTLSPSEYFDAVMFFRVRYVFENPQLRNTAQVGSGADVELPTNNAKQDTAEGIPSLKLHTVIGTVESDPANNYPVMQHDGETVKGVLVRHINADGTANDPPTGGRIEIAANKCKGSDGNWHKVYLQEITVMDNSCVAHKAIALISDYY